MRQRRQLLAILLAAGLTHAGLAGSPASAVEVFPQVISVNMSGEASGESNASAMSQDGTLVAFTSSVRDLVMVDTNGVQECFVRDRVSKVTTLVSVGEGGALGNAACYEPVVSADGSLVAFQSASSNLVPGDTNQDADIFVRDLRDGVTTLVSVDSAGAQFGDTDWKFDMSADGSALAFVAYEGGASSVWVHDRQSGTSTRVSPTDAIGNPLGISNDPAVSGDGNVVAYVSTHAPGAGGWTSYGWQLLALDRTTGVTSLVSVDNSGDPGDNGPGDPNVSYDGRYVVFESGATDLVAGDTNGVSDVFVRDRAAGLTTRVSMGADGAQGDGGSAWPSISDDGRFVVFSSAATNLVPGDTNSRFDVFSLDKEAGELTRLSVSSEGVQGDSDSTTGYGNLISGDGRFVSFNSCASNLVPGASGCNAFVTAINWSVTSVSVTADDKQVAVGEPLPAFSFTASGFEGTDTFTTEPTCTTTAKDTDTAGSYPITCSGASAPGYVFSYGAGTLTIRDIVPVTVTADDKSVTVGDPLPVFTHTDTGFVSPETFTTAPTCTTTATSGSGVGTYPITCSGGAAAAWYPVTYVPGTLTLNPITVTVTAEDKTMTLGEPLPAFTYTATGFSGADGFTAEPVCTTTATSASPAGSYPITCTGGEVGAEYAVTYVPGTLTINARTLTVTADNKTMTLGGPVPAFTYSVKGFKGQDTFTTSPTCTSPGASVYAPAGMYPIRCSGGVAVGYSIRYVDGTLTVNPGPVVTVTADNKTMTAGGPLPAFTYTVQGFQRKDTFTTKPTCSTTASITSLPGTYPIGCYGAVAPGYDVRYNTGTLTIQPKPVTVSGAGSYLINGTQATFTVNANSQTTKGSLEWSFNNGLYSLKASTINRVAEIGCSGYSRCLSVEGMGQLRIQGQPPRTVGFTATMRDSGSSTPDAFGIYTPNVPLPSDPTPLTNGGITIT